MRDWSYGVGRDSAHIYLVRWPWWLALIDWFSFWLDWQWLEKIPLPDWPRRRWSEYDEEDEKYTPREYYGDVGGLVFGCVCNPLIKWVHQHPRRKEVIVEMDYPRARELFYEESPDLFDDREARAAAEA